VLTPVGGGQGTAPVAAPVIGTIEPEVIPLSSSEVDYPLLRDAYANSALDSESEVLAWRRSRARAEAARRPPAPSWRCPLRGRRRAARCRDHHGARLQHGSFPARR